ncbi:hypothetical protein DZC78_13710 [Olleya aquimaris]|nr:hypothetical protein DZC78_13710 [Olleya aquimaris]
MAVNTFKLEFEDGVTKTLDVVVVSPTDIIMFVAGTQDPVNISALNHQANHNYWKASKDNLWGKVLELKPQFHDLNIEANFFSWSGDNSQDERNKAAERLLDLMTREYPKFKNKETHLHLIGHSHGGNVINQFTELITTDSRFPKLWEVKSITYLSTPFFKEKHQLNHAKLHEDCQIINVHNDYDITQRFVADFSLNNLEKLIHGFNAYEFYKSKQRIDLIMSSGVFAPLTSISIVSDSKHGVLIWQRVSLLLDSVNDILDLIITMINNPELKNLSTEKAEITKLLTDLKSWIPTAKTRLNNRVTQYQQKIENINSSSEEEGFWGQLKDNLGKAADSISNSFSDTFETTDLITDLNMERPLKVINKILFIDKGLEDAYLLGLLERIFTEQAGVTDTIDNTSWDPKDQINGKFDVIDVPITEEDVYHSRGLKSKFEKFVSSAEKSIEDGNLKEFLIILVSQIISSESIEDKGTALWWADLLFKDEADDEFKKLRRDYLPNYTKLIEKYEAHLIAPQDKPKEEKSKKDKNKTPDAFTEAAKLKFNSDLIAINNISKQQWETIVKEEKEKNREDEEKNPPLPPVIGSLAHFATVSHGLSHTRLWDKVEEGLKSSFSSGKNPGYKG